MRYVKFREILTGYEAIMPEMFSGGSDNCIEVFTEKRVTDAIGHITGPEDRDAILTVIVKPLYAPEITYMKHDLKTMKKVVGGPVECVGSPEYPGFDIVCNEEGKLTGMLPNRDIDHNGELADIIFGNFFVTRFDEEGRNAGLRPDEAERFLRLYAMPRFFVYDKVLSRIVAYDCPESAVQVFRENGVSLIL